MVDVLVVDDDFDIRDTLCEVLADNDFSVAVAADGEEALTWLRTNEAPALVLLDWMMPGRDGASFRAEQLGDPRIARIPVVVLSADPRLEKRTRELGVDAYLKKPVELDALLAIVRRLVERTP